MTKVCSKCKKEKSLSEFNKQSQRKDGIRPDCKQCQKEYNRQFYLDNLEYYKEMRKKWNEANAEYKKKKNKEYYENNKERCFELSTIWRKNNPEKRKEIVKRWIYNNWDQHIASSNRYKGSRRGATPEWADKGEIKYIYELAKERGLVVDHIVPLNSEYVCGLHCADNLRCIPAELNNYKGNRYWPDMPD